MKQREPSLPERLWKLRRMRVEVLENGHYIHKGSVLLRDYASPFEAERALVTVGVHAPRGMDLLLWTVSTTLGASARVLDANGTPIVLMREVKR